MDETRDEEEEKEIAEKPVDKVSYEGPHTNVFLGGGAGAVIGFVVGGPLGAAAGAAIGGFLGAKSESKEE